MQFRSSGGYHEVCNSEVQEDIMRCAIQKFSRGSWSVQNNCNSVFLRDGLLRAGESTIEFFISSAPTLKDMFFHLKQNSHLSK